MELAFSLTVDHSDTLGRQQAVDLNTSAKSALVNSLIYKRGLNLKPRSGYLKIDQQSNQQNDQHSNQQSNQQISHINI